MVVASRALSPRAAPATRALASATGPAIVLAALCLPFARAGTAVRDGFGLAQALQGSGLALGWVHLATVGVGLAPALVAGTIVLALAGRRRRGAGALAALLGASTGALGVAAGLLVETSGALHPEVGAALAAAGGGLALVAASRAAWPPRRRIPRRPDSNGEPSHG